jgi:pilus assembly protein CpaF
MTRELLDLVFRHDRIADLDRAERRLALRSLIAREAPAELPATLPRIADVVDGFGPLGDVMRDGEVTDILINGPREVWVERAGRLERTEVAFSDRTELRAFIDRLFGEAGTRVDTTCPVADARLADGSRIHVALPPVAPGGPIVSIRRFPPTRFSLENLIAAEMMTDELGAQLARAVTDRRTIAITGGTGSGKTTLLNALLAHVGAAERVVVIEETPELAPSCPHAVSLLARSPNLEGAGAVDISTLVRTALRMRPDRIIVGEVRGPEALAALGAMSTGHEGSMITLHARSATDAVERMVTLSLQAGSGATEEALRRQIVHALEVFVHLERCGSIRRVAGVVNLD